MIVAIPMAGLSRRFLDAGFTVPKYMLMAGEWTLFRHSIESFRSLFNNAQFVFIYRDIADTARFVVRECEAMGLEGSVQVCLAEPTRGQAETVALGLVKSEVNLDTSLIIFNIDTIRPGYVVPNVASACDGYLEVFKGEGDGWSFVYPKVGPGQRVAFTTEKRRVSEYCSTGLYYFRNSSQFLNSFEEELSDGPSQAGEFYVAPLYNRQICAGFDIRFEVIETSSVIFSGTPTEYDDFRAAF